MTEPEYQRFASHDGTHIAYRRSGHGPPVVLVHGYTVTSTTNFAGCLAYDDHGRPTVVPGRSVESALLDAGFSVVLFDHRGHGMSAKPHDPDRYSIASMVADVRSLVEELELSRAAVVGYSLGAIVAGHLLHDPWVTALALCGTGSYHVEGVDPEMEQMPAAFVECFVHGRWEEFPEYQLYRDCALLDPSADFRALGLVGGAMHYIPADALTSPTMPVLVLNGGDDSGARPEWDLTAYVPGARGVNAGTSDHVQAPSDPLFQHELATFLLSVQS